MRRTGLPSHHCLNDRISFLPVGAYMRKTIMWGNKHGFQLTKSKWNVVSPLITALTVQICSTSVSKATGCSWATPCRLQGHNRERCDEQTALEGVMFVDYQPQSSAKFQSVSSLETIFIFDELFVCSASLHSGVLISSSNNADVGTTLFAGTAC